uniref:Glycosyltransferase family 2 protein n=1 Tax=Gongylonema pulchrum TaxID=637853 RepID=A0A183F0C8_9BILA
LGSLSVYVVAILYEGGNEQEPIDRLIESGNLIASKDVSGEGDDELLAGRAGFLAAALTLREHIKKKIIPDHCIRGVLNKMIDSGRRYAAAGRFPVPLMYRYYGRHYLGAAHGVMGILQMLLW